MYRRVLLAVAVSASLPLLAGLLACRGRQGGAANRPAGVMAPNGAQGAGPGAGKGQWFCRAAGTYEQCNSSGFCMPTSAFGGGLGQSEQGAGMMAVQDCNLQRTKLQMIGNMNLSQGSHYRSKQPCQVTGCMAPKP